MQRDDFMKLKLKFAQTDVAGKIAIYTETPADVSDRKAGGAGSSISQNVRRTAVRQFFF